MPKLGALQGSVSETLPRYYIVSASNESMCADCRSTQDISSQRRTVQIIEGHCKPSQDISSHRRTLQVIAVHCQPSQDISSHRRTLQVIAEHCRSSQDIASHRRTYKAIVGHRKAPARQIGDPDPNFIVSTASY